ncbi:hypothetical protein ACVBAX_15640 [Robertmurraya sp. GLU-23]
MFVIATFENSIIIELTITELEQNEIPNDKILAVPLDKKLDHRQLFDTIHQADGLSLFDLAAIIGTCLMLLGAIYGYLLEWGPIIWGIIGAVSGLLIGFIIKMLLIKKNKRATKSFSSEIVLMIRCEKHQWHIVENILWKNGALGLSRIRHL